MKAWVQKWAVEGRVVGYTLHGKQSALKGLLKYRAPMPERVAANDAMRTFFETQRQRCPVVPARAERHGQAYPTKIRLRDDIKELTLSPYGLWYEGNGFPAATATRARKFEIAAIVGMSWRDAGSMLHAQRRLVGQLLRVGSDALTACSVMGAPSVKAKVCPDARGTSDATVAYQAVLNELRRLQGAAEEKAKKKTPAKGKKKSVDKTEPQPVLPTAICGGMASAISGIVKSGRSKRPSYNGEQPIPVRAQEIHAIRKDDMGYVIDVRLLDRNYPVTTLALRRSKGAHWSLLRDLSEGRIEHGAAQILYDETRRKWYITIACEVPIAEPATIDRDRALVVHRGVRDAITLMDTTGGYYRINADKVLARLRRIEARMRSSRRIPAELLGDGAKGHGKGRRYQHYETLRGKRGRILKSYYEKLAALIINYAKRKGIGHVVFEDYGGIGPNEDDYLRRALSRYPLYMLKQILVNATELAGLTYEEVPSEYISSTCPACGCQDVRQHRRHRDTFRCFGGCNFVRPANMVAALHMMRRAKLDTSVWDERFEKARQFERERPDTQRMRADLS